MQYHVTCMAGEYIESIFFIFQLIKNVTQPLRWWFKSNHLQAIPRRFMIALIIQTIMMVMHQLNLLSRDEYCTQ